MVTSCYVYFMQRMQLSSFNFEKMLLLLDLLFNPITLTVFLIFMVSVMSA